MPLKRHDMCVCMCVYGCLQVHDETVKASAQRNKLAAALEAKRGPLLQAKERFTLRKARPARETVNDDVEAALTREIAHLNAVTSQLSDKVGADVDACIGHRLDDIWRETPGGDWPRKSPPGVSTGMQS